LILGEFASRGRVFPFFLLTDLTLRKMAKLLLDPGKVQKSGHDDSVRWQHQEKQRGTE